MCFILVLFLILKKHVFCIVSLNYTLVKILSHVAIKHHSQICYFYTYESVDQNTETTTTTTNAYIKHQQISKKQ